jgi:2-oxo-4-hydroxy-4-carboxy-5-ureidoimidazoline decarboxylase
VTFALSQINGMTPEEFVTVAGPVFEHSPWVAERSSTERPFSSLDAMHAAMVTVVQRASAEEQLALIGAHPDLVGRAVLTPESRGEQAAAGLMDLSPEERDAFDRYNRAYKERFGFPFVICARLNKKEAILAAFPRRLQNTPEQERATALEEISKIARLRLEDLIR